MDRRSALRATAGTLGTALAGCVVPFGGHSSAPAAPTAGLVEAGPGEFPHEIVAHNDRAEPVAFTLVVTRGETVLYEDDHRAPATDSRVVAGFTRETLPAGERSVRVAVRTAGGPTRHVDIRVDDCLGDVIAQWGSEGATVFYSIC